MEHQFDIEHAKLFGVDEAIMIHSFIFWITKNRANERNFYDGHYWTYNKPDAYQKLFPFWTDKQIRRILNSLVDKGVLITGNYNTNKYDQTKWYSFQNEEMFLENIFVEEKGNCIGLNGKFEFTKRENGIYQMGSPIPYNNTYNIKNNIHIKENTKENDEHFMQCWDNYPKQRIGSKDKAYKSYLKVIKEKRIEKDALLEKIKEYAVSEEVSKGFAKGFSAWLNDDRFNCEYKKQENLFDDDIIF